MTTLVVRLRFWCRLLFTFPRAPSDSSLAPTLEILHDWNSSTATNHPHNIFVAVVDLLVFCVCLVCSVDYSLVKCRCTLRE